MDPPLLIISVIAILLPGAFVLALSGSPGPVDQLILNMSHGVCLPLSGVNERI